MDEAMDLGALRDSIRGMLGQECPQERIVKHAQNGNGMDQTLWTKAVDLGWTMISVPEEHGGLGLGIEALALLYEEAGRAAAPLPLLSTMLAVQAMAESASPEQRATWLPRLAQGAVAACANPAIAGAPALSIVFSGAWLILNGTMADLLDGADAELLVVAAQDTDGATHRVVLDVADDGLAPQRQALWDRGRSLASLTLDGLRLPADRAWLSAPAAEQALANHAAIALAADSIGGQRALIDLTVEYLKTRQQFGRAIGSFQALKHRMADHRTRLEGDLWLTRSAVDAEANKLDHRNTEASAAKALATAHYGDLGRDAIQLHGGIGFTAEYPAHVFVKRALLNEQLFGQRAFHLHRAAGSVMAGVV